MIGGSGTDCLTLVREMSRKQESPPSFIFSNWKGQKHRKIPYEIALGSGGKFIEREGVSTLSIHGLLDTFSKCFQNCFSLCL